VSQTPPPEDPPLADRRIIVGVGGGIAVYKVAALVSALVQAGGEVTVAMTEAGARFVTPLTFQALTGRPVYTSQWEHVEAHDPQHVALARSADLMLIAPATMDILAKLATGRADDVVTLIAAAIDRTRQRVLVAPSMNAVMYRQPATQRNIAQLEDDGFVVIPPSSGWQACRTEGVGRLPEPAELMNAVTDALAGSSKSA
jgi:phosphopantothenoylcysteine decarboxylase/phosphopantothenate--cysteine ligase